MPTSRELMLALNPELATSGQSDPIVSRARQDFDARRDQAASQVECSVHVFELTRFREKALRVTERYRQELARLNAMEGQYSDLTPAQVSRRRNEIREAMAGAVTAVVIEHNHSEGELRGQWARRDAPAYPVKADDAARIAATLAVMNSCSPSEVAGIVRQLVEREDRPALQQLLPVIRTKLGEHHREQNGTVKVMDAELGPLAAAFEDAELALLDIGALAGRHAAEVADRIRSQVAVVARTLVEEGDWEGTSAARIRTIGPDGEQSSTPDFDEP